MQEFQRSQLVVRRRLRRSERQSRVQRSARRLGQVFAVLLLTAFALAFLAAGAAYNRLIVSLPDTSILPQLLDAQSGALIQPTRIYDRSGTHVLAALENPGIERRMLPLNSALTEGISPLLIQAVTALLEPLYWETPYIDLRSLTAERDPTIAERLVTNLLLPDPGDGFTGRLRRHLLAGQALTRYGRAQVLEWYLNSAGFGHLTFGVESAAQLYLGKSAANLSPAETALLMAALETPALNPVDSPTAAHENQLSVLQRLADAGVINETEFETAWSQPIIVPPVIQPPSPVAAAFTDLVLDTLAGEIDRQTLERGGVKILTTLDYDLQVQLNCAILTQLQHISSPGEIKAAPACPAASLLPQLDQPVDSAGAAPLAASGVVLDPLTGEVLALTGDITLAGGEGAETAHPSGTLQTPILALAGFARSLSPASLVWDLPVNGSESAQSAVKSHGPVRLRTALVNDYLPAMAQVLQQVGPAAMITTARSLGLVNFTLANDPMEALENGAPLTPLEAAFGYSVFATLGEQNGVQQDSGSDFSPRIILSVEIAAGNGLYSAPDPGSKPVVTPELAYLVHHILADAPARWPTLGHPNALEIDHPAGAKTGSALGGASTWAIGYTRQTVSAVWMGYANPKENAEALDRKYAAGIWQSVMQYISQGQPGPGWDPPSGIVTLEVCDPSGMLPSADCPNIVPEIFLRGNEPLTADTLYQRFEINRETGNLATVFTPPEMVDEQVFMVVPPEAQAWSQIANLPVPPQDYDPIQLPRPDPIVHIDTPEQFSYVRGKVMVSGTASGDGFSSYSLQLGRGINPTAWQSIGESSQTPIEDSVLAEIDTSGMDGLYILRLLVLYEGQRIKTAMQQMTVDNTPPSVTMPYPLPDQVFTGPLQRSITLQAEVSDAIGVERVEWWVNGRKAGETKKAPYAWVWDATVGEHRLEVRAIDHAGNESRTNEISVVVQP